MSGGSRRAGYSPSIRSGRGLLGVVPSCEWPVDSVRANSFLVLFRLVCFRLLRRFLCQTIRWISIYVFVFLGYYRKQFKNPQEAM